MREHNPFHPPNCSSPIPPLCPIYSHRPNATQKQKHKGKERERMEALRHLLILTATAVVASTFCYSFAASAPAEFVRSSCKVTQYPDLCEKCLSGYGPAVRHSPRNLARAALIVTAGRALTVSTYVHRMSAGGKRSSTTRESGAVRDCMETLDDTVGRLRQSVKELERMGRYRSRSFKWHLSNVQTWVSASLTDENTCLESLSQDKSTAGFRSELRRQVVDVSKLTSNALALVNRLDS